MDIPIKERRVPDFAGEAAQAWRIPRKFDIAPGTKLWFVHAPHSHPVFKWYLVMLLNLQELEDAGVNPIIRKEGATHEIGLVVISPESYPPDVDGEGHPPGVLRPANYVGQFIAEDDEAAIQRIVDDAIRPLCDGTLSPDTDNQIGWIKRFGGDCIISVGTGESYSHMEH